MLFCCRVAKEIWSLSEISTAIDVNQADIIPHTVLGFFSSQDRNPQKTLPWFLGLRIWKMRNKLLFENKRDHILSVIHAAHLDYKTWMEEMIKANVHTEQPQRSKINSIQEVHRPETKDYCIVDASWISPTDKAGIGWSLHSREGTLRIRGSSAIHQTISPLVAEASAMLLAVQQMVKLSYKKVMFVSDCQLLIKILHQVQAWEVIKKLKWTTSIIQDIWNYSKNNSSSFSFVPRTCTQYADLLAKMARINDQNYVISRSS